MAAELAVRSTDRLAALVLVDSLGIKVGGREDRTSRTSTPLQSEVARLFYHDPEANRRDITRLPDHVLRSIARAREAMCMFRWKPYMHTPSLKRWLRRIGVPALVLWGESDGVVSTEYGRAFAGHIPGAAFRAIPQAGHYPHLEQLDAFAKRGSRIRQRPEPDAPERLTSRQESAMRFFHFSEQPYPDDSSGWNPCAIPSRTPIAIRRSPTGSTTSV